MKPLTRPFVVTIANQKGGVGKTTTAVNLAVELHSLGIPTVLVDMDAQGNATTGLDVEVGDDQPTVYEVIHPDFEKRIPASEALLGSPYGPRVVAGHLAMSRVERDGNGAGGEMSLAAALDGLDPCVVVIDTPPNLGRLTVMALHAAGADQGGGEVVAPCSPGVNELEGLQRLMTTLRELRANGLARHGQIGGVLVTDYDARNKLSKDTRRQLSGAFTDTGYLGEISSTVRVGESTARRMPLRDYRPDSTAAQDYRNLAIRWAKTRGLAAS